VRDAGSGLYVFHRQHGNLAAAALEAGGVSEGPSGQKRFERGRLGDFWDRVKSRLSRLPLAGRGRAGGLLALALCAAPAAAEPGVLRVGTSGDYPPFSSAAPGDPASFAGFDVALARAYAEERGLALELVRFRWPELLAALGAGRFEVAMSGVTVDPGRSLAGRFSVPVTESGALVLVRDEGRFGDLDAVNRRGVRIGVNAGGHLERVSRARFPRATLVAVPENPAVLDALVELAIDAAVTDTLEAPLWRERAGDLALVALGPFTRDRKAYLVRPDRAELAADLDAWLLARERDGTLSRLRREHLGGAAGATATPLNALLAALDERLALMPWVVAAKRRDALPVVDPTRERRVVEAGVAASAAAARRAGRAPPAEPVLRAFFRASIDAAVQVQLAAGRAPEAPPGEVPDLEDELRPALLRIDERIAALLVALPADLDAAAVERAAREGLRSPWLPEASRRALSREILASAVGPRSEPQASEAPKPASARARAPAAPPPAEAPARARSAAGRSASPGSAPPTPRSGGAPAAPSP
jgi:cyclohexadienyl dehydratase